MFINLQKYTLTIAVVVMYAAFIASTSTAKDLSSDKIVVFTVNYPLKYFAERIGGDSVKVVFPAPPDVDPAYWIPDRSIVSKYQEADLILLNGAHYAKWIDKVSMPRARMVNTSKKARDRYVRIDEAVTHSHGPGGEHAHEDAAFTIWLDFELAVMQAKAIEEALSRKMPGQRARLRENFTALMSDLMALDRQLMAIVSRDKDRPILASHPVYDYLRQRYSLNLKSVHWKPGIEPSLSQWHELRKTLEEHRAQWMMWEGKPLEKTVRKLQESGIRSFVFNPCGNSPDKGDFLTTMKENIENLRDAYE